MMSLLMIAVITAVLLCDAVLVLFLSERMVNENERSRLNVQADQLAQTVKINELLQTSQLAKLEVSNGPIISIWVKAGRFLSWRVAGRLGSGQPDFASNGTCIG